MQIVLNDLVKQFTYYCGSFAAEFPLITNLGKLSGSCYIYMILGGMGLFIGFLMYASSRPALDRVNSTPQNPVYYNQTESQVMYFYISMVILLISAFSFISGITNYMSCGVQKTQWLNKLATVNIPSLPGQPIETGLSLYNKIEGMEQSIQRESADIRARNNSQTANSGININTSGFNMNFKL